MPRQDSHCIHTNLISPNCVLGTSKKAKINRGEDDAAEGEASEDPLRNQRVGNSAFQGANDFDDFIMKEDDESSFGKEVAVVAFVVVSSSVVSYSSICICCWC